MKMTNKIAGWARKGILTGAIALGGVGAGCASVQNDVGAGISFGVGQIGNNLSRQERIVYVHPSDGGNEKGGVSMSVNKANGAFFAGHAEDSFGTKNFRVIGGVEGKLNSFGAKDKEQQPLPSPYESYGWAEFSQDMFSWGPYVGVEGRFDIDNDSQFVLGTRFGRPRTGFEFTRGHERYGGETTEFSDSWEGYGKSYGAYIGIGLGNKRQGDLVDVSLEWMREEYDTSICHGTEVKSNLFSLKVTKRF